MEFQLLSSHKIDKQKWDECLYNSINPLIYASSAYLDGMADNWDGIVSDDYSYIMPVPWRKKFGIKYCYDVPFIQQLGVFGKVLEREAIDKCFQLLFRSFKYGDYAFNYMNYFKQAAVSNNYVLSLASNYRSTSLFYSSVIESNLNIAKKFPLEYGVCETDEAFNLFIQLYADRLPHVHSADYAKFSELCRLKTVESNIAVRKISLHKTTVAAVLFLKDKYRMYNLMFATTAEGKHKSAGHFLFDSVIKEFSQTGMLLDFEGSDIPGIEKFNKSFGAIKQPYYTIHLNTLPFPLNMFKR